MKKINKITESELYEAFRKHNRDNNIKTKGEGTPIYGVVVFKNSNFKKNYPVKARSYIVSSDNKAFIEGQLGYSIFGSALDGSDPFVRLDWYNWKAEYCYFTEAK